MILKVINQRIYDLGPQAREAGASIKPCVSTRGSDVRKIFLARVAGDRYVVSNRLSPTTWANEWIGTHIPSANALGFMLAPASRAEKQTALLKIHRIFLSLLFFVFAVITANAQWKVQEVKTDAAFRGLSVVNANVVWASGTKGTFVKTTDGGKSWMVGNVSDAEKLDFRDVEAFDANTAYLLSIGNGDASRIYKTTDGGKTWTLQFKNENPKAFFDAMAFWDAQHGIAMSDPVDGRILLIATDDGGKSWKPLPTENLPQAQQGEAAFAASGTCIITRGKNNVWIATGGGAARVFHSTDRGRSWAVAPTPLPTGEAAGIFSIAFLNANDGIIVGGDYKKPDEAKNNVAVTNDGGKTWTLADAKGLGGFRSGVVYSLDSKSTVNFAVGTSGSDVSINSGKTWQKIDAENYNSIAYAQPYSIWAVGPKGRIAKFELNWYKSFTNKK